MASLRELRIAKVEYVETEDAQVRLQKLLMVLQEIAHEAVDKHHQKQHRKGAKRA